MLFFPSLVRAWSQENINRIEAQLQSIMVKNPKKSRPTCTKAFKQHAQVAADMKGDEGAQEATDSTKGDKKEPEQAEAEALDGVELEIWEISDGEQDPPALQDVAGSIAFKLLFSCLQMVCLQSLWKRPWPLQQEWVFLCCCLAVRIWS